LAVGAALSGTTFAPAHGNAREEPNVLAL
jgi:hypothetical protein